MIIAIVGRPNVGKSTLFNRLAGKKIAIVEDFPGVTRDRNLAQVSLGEHSFTLIDTGGIQESDSDELTESVCVQARRAVEDADLILFTVDVRQGFLPYDAEIAKYLRNRAKDVIVVVNKVDGPNMESAVFEFHAVGFDSVVPVSAEHGLGMGELVEALEGRFAAIPAVPEPAPDEALKLAVIGRPNVGKSSFVNRILGENRLIVSPLAGTTRDAIDSAITFNGKDYVLIDTAGIRRKSRVERGVEHWSVMRAIRTIERAHVCLVLVDAVEGLTDQDAKIIELALRGGRGVGLCLNKWDAVEKDGKTFDAVCRDIRVKLGVHAHLPILSMSVLKGLRVEKALELAGVLHESWSKRVSTSEVNSFLEGALRRLQIPVMGSKRARIYYMTQARTAPPAFIAFSSNPQSIPVSYQRYMMNRLREAFGFEGIPVAIRYRKRTRSDERD